MARSVSRGPRPRTTANRPASLAGLRRYVFPANGPGIERCDNGDGECSAFGGDFQDAGLGLYVLWVHPVFDPPSEFPWKAGSYAFVLRVSDRDGTQGYGFGEIEIAE